MFVEYPFSCFTFNYKLLILYFKLFKSNFYLLLFCSLSFYQLFIIYTVYLLKYQREVWTLTSSKDEQARGPKMLQVAATSILPAPQRNSPEVSCLPLSHLPEQTHRSKLPQHNSGLRGMAMFPAATASLTSRQRSPSWKQPWPGQGLSLHSRGLQSAADPPEAAAGLLRGSCVVFPRPNFNKWPCFIEFPKKTSSKICL